VELSGQLLERLKPAKIIKEHTKDIVGMDFSDDGQILYVADAQTLNVYLTVNGQSYRKLSLKIHEIEQVCHTHNNSAVLVATKKNHLVLYWSIHENRVIKMFKGHTDSIASLILNPKDDYFLTTSSDNSMRIWNLNSKGQGKHSLTQTASSS
jgi:COMPASS component SWD2